MGNQDYNEYVLYPGRFQPPHLGHMTIFEESLKENRRICIAIRNIKPDEKNPLEPEMVKQLWERIYHNNSLVKVIIIPNISGIRYGRSVGYSVEEIKVSQAIATISATDIRKSISLNDDSWKDHVHNSIWDDLKLLFSK